MAEPQHNTNKAIPWGFISAIVGALLTGICTLFVAIPTFVDMFKPDPTPIIIINPAGNSQLPSAGQPQPSNELIPTSEVTFFDLTGIWDFQVTASQIVGRDGFINDANASADYVIRIDQNQNRLSGEMTGALGDVANVCNEAKITGTIQGVDLSFVVQYAGACCHNERIRFTGVYDPNSDAITGKSEPVGIPITDCYLWYSDFTAIQR